MSDTDEPKNAVVVDIETDNNLSEKKDEGTSENNLNSSISNTAADEVAESSSDNETDTAEWRVLSRPSSLDMSKSPILKKANYNRVAAYYKRENGLISAYQNIAEGTVSGRLISGPQKV